MVLDGHETLDHDSQIVACRGETSHFGHDEWREVTNGLNMLAVAQDPRDRIFDAFQEASAADPAARDQWLTFVVVAGAPGLAWMQAPVTANG